MLRQYPSAPPTKRRDRRAGRGEARLRSALLSPTPDVPLTSRGRRSRRRLLDRFDAQPGRLLRLALVSATLVAVVVAVLEFRDGGGLVDLEGAKPDYAALVAAAHTSCGAGICAFGNGTPSDPPSGVRSLMSRLRVRALEVEPSTGVTALSAGYVSQFELVFVPSGPSRRQWDDALEDGEGGVIVGGVVRRRSLEAVGDGWYRVSR